VSKIAAISTRELKDYQFPLLDSAGMFYAKQGHEIHTGNAKGSDQAFAHGANCVNPNKVHLYLPWLGYEPKAILGGNVLHFAHEAGRDLVLLAERCHPNWKALPQSIRNLMIRNTMIVIGASMVLANPNRKKEGYGGTGHGMRVAVELGIPVWLVTEHTWWDAI
jgi:hypothetical protein